MTENDSGTLQFESPEQENAHLREENARLRRLLVVHSIAIPQLTPANPPPAKTAEMAPVDKEAGFRQMFVEGPLGFHSSSEAYPLWKQKSNDFVFRSHPVTRIDGEDGPGALIVRFLGLIGRGIFNRSWVHRMGSRVRPR